MVFMQIVIGGITRLTGSGLSITEWDIVFGTFPPIGETQWLDEFIKYQATPQYQKINEGMSLSDFKFIYFWEYFHRLWARMMGIAFLIPFIVFWFLGMEEGLIHLQDLVHVSTRFLAKFFCGELARRWALRISSVIYGVRKIYQKIYFIGLK